MPFWPVRYSPSAGSEVELSVRPAAAEEVSTAAGEAGADATAGVVAVAAATVAAGEGDAADEQAAANKATPTARPVSVVKRELGRMDLSPGSSASGSCD
jgi:hypothetical protein